MTRARATMSAPETIRTREWRGWILHECDAIGSTNDFARGLAPWEAVRADRQTAARGRHGRKWESGRGGLWISAVLPTEPPDVHWGAFPLAAGLAVASVLHGLGVHGTRLRWPNDVLVGPRKICGILMEKFHSGSMVVGIGLNVDNDPAGENPELSAIATSLARELPSLPPMDEIFENILIALRVLHGRMAEEGFGSLAGEINQLWGGPRRVELTTATGSAKGAFLGIDSRGDLLLETGGRTGLFSAPHVQRLHEI